MNPEKDKKNIDDLVEKEIGGIPVKELDFVLEDINNNSIDPFYEALDQLKNMLSSYYQNTDLANTKRSNFKSNIKSFFFGALTSYFSYDMLNDFKVTKIFLQNSYAFIMNVYDRIYNLITNLIR